MTFGAKPQDWRHFDELGLGSDLLPVVSRPDAKISPKSNLKQIGKTPSLYNGGQMVVGMKQWTDHQASDAEIRRWSLEADYGICVQTRTMRFLDVDVAEREVANAIVTAVGQVLGIRLPCRRRPNTGKCGLAFRLIGFFPKRIMRVEGGVIEFLGNGQQFVAVGTHPSGVRYEWDGGLPERLPELTPEQFEQVWSSLEIQFAIEEPRIQNSSEHRGADLEIPDPVAEFLLDNALVLDQDNRAGKLHVACPWNDEHSSGEPGDGSTSWLIAGTRGHAEGHFRCMHAHCSHRTRQDFLSAIGYQDTAALDGFEVYPPLEEPPGEDSAPSPKTHSLEPTEFEWIDPTQIPRRQWLYGRHLIRKFVSATISPGGIGKSSLEIVDAIAMATGRDLVGSQPTARLKVWIWNGEDPRDELQRRVAAACLHYGIGREEIRGQLFVDSGRDTPIVLAEDTRDGTKVATPVVDALIRVIRERAIDVLVIDPFVSSHRVTENDNNAIDRVVKLWARIADVTGCAISLVHHSRKTGGAEVSAEDARGASALVSAARSVRTLNPMSSAEAAKAGITGNPRLYFYVDASLGKANLAPPADKRTWYHLKSVALGNNDGLEAGDQVGVVTSWTWSPASDRISGTTLREIQELIEKGEYRASDRVESGWAGEAIAEVLGLDLTKKDEKAKARGLLADWLKAGYFEKKTMQNGRRQQKPFVKVGKWAEEDDDLSILEGEE